MRKAQGYPRVIPAWRPGAPRQRPPCTISAEWVHLGAGVGPAVGVSVLRGQGCRITNGQGVVLARRTQMSDDISFFDNIKGFDMVMSLDFYTKAVFKRIGLFSPNGLTLSR